MRNDAIKLPVISHLQYLFLSCMPLDQRSVAARELQATLCTLGIDQSGPKLYQLLKRLVESEYISVDRSERWATYSLTKTGQEEISNARNFYKEVMMPP